MADQNDFDKKLEERFSQLPKIVQQAITSAEIENNLRKLADTQKLHIDQWQKLENEVMLALYGFQKVENLEKNIKSEIGISDEVARLLAENVNKIVFEPIRQELERQLEHPEAREKKVGEIEAAGAQLVASSLQPVANTDSESATSNQLPAANLPVPATPPAPKPEVKVTRPSDSTAYRPGETSATRGSVTDDPYRLPPV